MDRHVEDTTVKGLHVRGAECYSIILSLRDKEVFLFFGFFFFFLLSFMSFLYVLDINPLSNMWLANIFPIP